MSLFNTTIEQILEDVSYALVEPIVNTSLLTGIVPFIAPLQLVDANGILWQVNVDSNGILSTTKLSAGSSPQVFVNDPAGTTSWLLGVTTGGVLTTTQVTFNRTNFASVPVSSVFSIFVTSAGIIQTISGTLNVLTPQSMSGIYVGAVLLIDVGTSQEQVTVTAVTATTFTATYTKPHIIGAPVVGATFPSGVPDHPLFTQNEVFEYVLETQNDFLLKTRCIYEVTGSLSGTPPNTVVSRGVRFYPQPSQAIRVERIAAITTGQPTIDLFEATQSDLDLGNSFWVAESGKPRQWFRDQIDTSQLGLYPLPDENLSLEFWYSKRGPVAGVISAPPAPTTVPTSTPIGLSPNPQLVATLPATVVNPLLIVDPVTGRVASIDQAEFPSLPVVVINATTSHPSVLRSGTLNLSTFSLNFNLPCIAYINGNFYIARSTSSTSVASVAEISDSTFAMTGNSLPVDTTNNSSSLPSIMIAVTINNVRYLVWLDNFNQGRSSNVNLGVGSLANYSLLGKALVLPFNILNATQPYPVVNPITGQIFIVFAYNPTNPLYGGGSAAPTNWRVVRVNPFGPVSAGQFTDVSVFDFPADADGNCGIGAFCDTVNNRLVIICNKGAIKLFDVASHSVVSSFGNAVSPAYAPGDEYPFDSQFNTVGTVGWPAIFGGEASNGFLIQNNVTDPLGGGGNQSGVILDVRLSKDLSLQTTMNIKSLFPPALITGGLKTYNGMAYYPPSNLLFYTLDLDSANIYVVSLGTTIFATVTVPPTGPNLSLTANLLIPDVMAHYIKYGVLAKCWSKDGETRNPLRAEYCQKRYDMGIVLVQRFMEGIGMESKAPAQKFNPMAIARGAR